MARLDGGEVGDARIASTVRFGAEPGSENLLGNIVGERAIGKTQHVGVVPDSGAGCLAGVGAQGRADAGHLVRRDADTRTGPAEEHPLIAVALRHRLGGRLRGQRPRRLRAQSDRTEGHDMMAVALKPVAHSAVYGVGLVRAKGNPHPLSVDFRAASWAPAGPLLEEEPCIRRLVHCEQSVGHVEDRRVVDDGEPGNGQAAPACATE